MFAYFGPEQYDQFNHTILVFVCIGLTKLEARLNSNYTRQIFTFFCIMYFIVIKKKAPSTSASMELMELLGE